MQQNLVQGEGDKVTASSHRGDSSESKGRQGGREETNLEGREGRRETRMDEGRDGGRRKVGGKRPGGRARFVQ